MLYYYCPLKIKIAQFPDGFRLYIVLLSNNCLFTQFSYGATDLALTTEKTQYPLFFRTVPTEIVFNEPRLQFVQHFGWMDEIGLIYDASPYYSQVRQISCIRAFAEFGYFCYEQILYYLSVFVFFLKISKGLAKSLRNNGTKIVANEGFTQDPAVAVKILKVRFSVATLGSSCNPPTRDEALRTSMWVATFSILLLFLHKRSY